ncbi:ABC transporter ATP-binding protein [Microbacterium koreense]|uniref:ABC transporter ATP-binding protein n=1 Tax=Microbacterium koreense TaxID=323761 RepID=A0ABW2ZN24_9MICO
MSIAEVAADRLEVGHPADPVIEADGISVAFEGVKALEDVTLAVGRNEVFGLIGPNGAGKTTFMNVLSGFQRPTAGSVRVGGGVMTGVRPEKIAKAGVGRTFQAVRPFGRLTVQQNVELGAIGAGVARREVRERTAEMLDALSLTHRRDSYADALPHGEERRLGIARALAGGPQVLLLDEPAAGTNESESDELVASLLAVKARFSCSLVIIEHDMRLIMGICERIHVLDFGRSIAEGTPAQVRANPAVLEAYLGVNETSETGGQDAAG